MGSRWESFRGLATREERRLGWTSAYAVIAAAAAIGASALLDPAAGGTGMDLALLVPGIVFALVFLLALYLVFAPLMHWWPHHLLSQLVTDPPPAEPTSPTPSWQQLNDLRVQTYERNRGLFLVHSCAPSTAAGQVVDAHICLTQHSNGPLDDESIQAVEYTFGPQFTDHSLVRTDPQDGYCVTVSMWGPMLCLAKVYFRDGTPPLLLERYISFETT